MKKNVKTVIFTLTAMITVLALFLIFPYLSLLTGRDEEVQPIPNGPLYALVKEQDNYILLEPTWHPSPIPHSPIPQHPYMADNSGNNMHNDAYMSDTYEGIGPIGPDLQISSRSQGFGGYGTVTFDRYGRLVAVYSNTRKFQLELMDAQTLKEIASFDLPSRPWHFPLTGVMPWEYIGAGMYFYLDHQNRAVVPTTENTIQVIQVPSIESQQGFTLVRQYDLSDDVVSMPWPHSDSVAWVLPEWGGEYYWFATTEGVIGVVNEQTGAIQKLKLTGEIIENSFAVGEDGVFIISDHALYRYYLDDQGNIIEEWRVGYDRGPNKKPGHITRGSGSSVTLLGGKDGYVAVTDNAEPRIHLLFVKRSDGTVVCREPLFTEGQSGTDITVIGFEHNNDKENGNGIYSAIVENNWGHHTFPIAHPAPGITRIDLIQQGDGSTECQEVWTSPEKNIGVFKLSLSNGLIYLYYRDETSLINRWYLTTLDFYTGKTIYRQLTGTGIGYNNWAGALFVHPDGMLYSTTMFGLVMVRDIHP